MEITNIKLWDNEDYIYPIIQIKKGFEDNFKAHLKNYQKIEDYNIDDFLECLKKFDWYIGVISEDIEIFF